MKLYYQHGGITVYHGDCMDLLAQAKDKEYSLAICDPPYGIDAIKKVYEGRAGYISDNSLGSGKNGKRANHSPKLWDAATPNIEYFQSLEIKSKNQIIFGVNYYEGLIPAKGRIVWDKLNFGNDFSDGEIASYSGHEKVEIVYLAWNGLIRGDGGHRDPRIAIRDVNKFRIPRIHPTEKPVALYKWLLKNYAKPGDTILDTHGGSLSIAMACHDMGFELTVIEQDEEYLEKAVKRLSDHQSQLSLCLA